MTNPNPPNPDFRSTAPSPITDRGSENSASEKQDPLAGIIDDPTQVDDKYLTIFVDETEANLREFVELLLLSPEERNTDQVTQLMHKAHQIKGCAAVVGCSRVAAMAHTMEDVLERRISRSLLLTEAMVNSLLDCTDETTAFLEKMRLGEFGTDDFSRVVRRLIEADDQAGADEEIPSAQEDKPKEAEWKEKVVESLQPGLKGYIGRAAFREGLPLSNYKGQLVHKKLMNISDVIFFHPDPSDLEHLDTLEEIRFGVVSDVEAENITACLRVAGVVDCAVEPVEPPELNRPAPPKPSPGKESTGSVKASQTLRIETRQLDHLMNLAGQLIVNRAKLAQSISSIRKIGGYREELRGLEAAVDELTYISDNIRKALTETRMVPIDPLFSLFRRVLKDASDSSGKKIRLETLGAETRLDKRLIDELGDPLIHLVRNALDHGIELPHEREQQGKNAEGTLWLEAFQEGHDVVVRVKDDGRGLDVERIRNRAVERGFIDAQEAESLSKQEIIDFIWKPGFSTAQRVTTISGRGVGMDIVRDTIERLNGSIEVESIANEGCTFTMRLPLTLAIVPGLLMETEGEIHSVPTKSVVEVLRVRPEDARTVRERSMLNFRGRPLPVVGVDAFLGFPRTDRDFEHLTIVVLTHSNQQIGLLVDRVLGEQDLVIQSIARNYGPVAEVAGVGVLGDGRLTLILDIGALFTKYVGHGRHHSVRKAALAISSTQCHKDHA